MRAIEYISKHSASINHIAEIKRIIQELKPLRLDKNATDAYFNTILSTLDRRNGLTKTSLTDNVKTGCFGMKSYRSD